MIETFSPAMLWIYRIVAFMGACGVVGLSISMWIEGDKKIAICMFLVGVGIAILFPAVILYILQHVFYQAILALLGLVQ